MDKVKAPKPSFIMNEQEQRIFFELMRASLWGTPVHPELWSGAWSWKPIFITLERHTILAQVAGAILSLPQEYLPPMPLQLKLNQRVAFNVQQHYRFNKVVAEIFGLLEQEGLHPILLKGQSMAALFPEPTRRQCGDIDIYVGEEELDKAFDLLCSHVRAKGGDPKPEYGDMVNDRHHLLHYERIAIEVHWKTEVFKDPKIDNYYQKLTQEWLNPEKNSKIQLAGRTIDVPNYKFGALYLMGHVFNHFRYGGIGLRQLSDLALYIHHHTRDIEPQQLRLWLKGVGLMELWQSFGILLVDYLGVPELEFPFYNAEFRKRGAMLARLTLRGGNFGYYNFSTDEDTANVIPNTTREKIKYHIARTRWLAQWVPLLPWWTIRHYYRHPLFYSVLKLMYHD